MKIIDAHAHIFNEIKGQKFGEDVISEGYGMIRFGKETQLILPQSFEQNAFTADALIKLMDTEGVAHAVLLQNPVFGIINTEIQAAVNKYPLRFKGTIQVDPYQVDACSVIEEYASAGQNTVKFEVSEEWGWSGKHPDLSLVNEKFLIIWELISQLGLRVIIDPGPVLGNGYQVDNLKRIAFEFPRINFLIEHLGYLTTRLYNQTDAFNRWKLMIHLGRECQNVYFGFSAVGSLMNDAYPCLLSQSLLKEAISLITSDKLLWGSDIPTTLVNYTYGQMIDVVLKESKFLEIQDKEKIMFQNAQCFFDFQT